MAMTCRKESVCPLASELVSEECHHAVPMSTSQNVYPFAMVLRLRVLQVVCGISALVMGSVAFIEERGHPHNLALAVPAGCATVLAAAASIHTSRGFGGYRPGNCNMQQLRFLGPSARVAAPLAVLWTLACSLHAALVFQAARTLSGGATNNGGVKTGQNGTLLVLACIEIILTIITLAAVVAILRIDCRYDPD